MIDLIRRNPSIVSSVTDFIASSKQEHSLRISCSLSSSGFLPPACEGEMSGEHLELLNRSREEVREVAGK